MDHVVVRAPKAQPGDKVAVLSPSFAAPGFAPAIHEQAMHRLAELTGLAPVEYPTTRLLGATPEARANDLNAAFGDPEIRAVLATIGGEDQIAVTPHLDPAFVRADPKPFFGYSDNTNLLHWLSSAARNDARCTVRRPSRSDRVALRAAQRDVAIETVGRYNPDAVVVVGVPFGHTRPQWILPFGGEVCVDGAQRRVWADYD